MTTCPKTTSYFQHEILEYYQSNVLHESCKIFRKHFKELSKTKTNEKFIDPFLRSLTLPSACNLLFRTNWHGTVPVCMLTCIFVYAHMYICVCWHVYLCILACIFVYPVWELYADMYICVSWHEKFFSIQCSIKFINVFYELFKNIVFTATLKKISKGFKTSQIVFEMGEVLWNAPNQPGGINYQKDCV